MLHSNLVSVGRHVYLFWGSDQVIAYRIQVLFCSILFYQEHQCILRDSLRILCWGALILMTDQVEFAVRSINQCFHQNHLNTFLVQQAENHEWKRIQMQINIFQRNQMPRQTFLRVLRNQQSLVNIHGDKSSFIKIVSLDLYPLKPVLACTLIVKFCIILIF